MKWPVTLNELRRMGSIDDIERIRWQAVSEMLISMDKAIRIDSVSELRNMIKLIADQIAGISYHSLQQKMSLEESEQKFFAEMANLDNQIYAIGFGSGVHPKILDMFLGDAVNDATEEAIREIRQKNDQLGTDGDDYE